MLTAPAPTQVEHSRGDLVREPLLAYLREWMDEDWAQYECNYLLGVDGPLAPLLGADTPSPSPDLVRAGLCDRLREWLNEEVVEVTADELLAADGPLARLFNLQATPKTPTSYTIEQVQ